MKTHTTISITKKLKHKVEKRAKEDNISASDVVRMLLTDYAEGRIEIIVRYKPEKAC